MHSLMVRKGKNSQIQGLHPPDMSDPARKANLGQNWQKQPLVKVGGFDKLDKPAMFAPIEVTTLNIRQYLSILGGSKNSRPSYLLRILPQTLDNFPWYWITSFAHKPTQNLGGLCTIRGPQNTCVKLCGTLMHTSTLHVSPGIGVQTLGP